MDKNTYLKLLEISLLIFDNSSQEFLLEQGFNLEEIKKGELINKLIVRF